MTKRTRLFLFVAAGILVAGLGTGLVASYVGQSLIIGTDGPDELGYIPADSQLVAWANVREIMNSDLRRRITESVGARPGANTLEEQTGINIERDVEQVFLSIADGDNPQKRPPLAIVRGTFDRDLIEQFLKDKGAVPQTYQNTPVYTHAESDSSIAFIGPELVAAGTTAAVRRALDTKVSGNDVRDNAELMRLLRESDNGNAWAVARFDALTGSARLPAELANQLPAITWFAANGHINGGVRGTVRAETRDPMAADDLRQVIQGFVALARMQTRQRPEFAEVLNSLQLGGFGNTVSLDFAVPSEVLESIGAFTARHALPAPERPQPATPQPAPSQPGTPAL